VSVLNVDTDHAREVEGLLTPEVVEGLQRAAETLALVLPQVREAMNVLEPLQEAYQDAGFRRYKAGEVSTDDVYDALRDRTPYGRAIDLTHDIADEVKRVAY
jgi:hypothetical protein